jgi:hypothetical protein
MAANMQTMSASPSLYLETTIPSYLCSRPSPNSLIAGQQAATHRWWQTRRRFFHLYISQFVVNEAGMGETNFAAKRLQILNPIEKLRITPEVDLFARRILSRRLLPEKAAVDAFHIATAAVHGIHFMLTWNCAHINNAEIIPDIEGFAAASGYALPVICTPLELMGVSET